MKRNILVMFVTLFVFSLITIGCSENSDPITDFEYKAISGGVEITRYIGTSIKINIPSKIEGEPVISIGNNAFQNCGLMEVDIPKSVLSIGNHSFADNSGLKSVSLPVGLLNIGDGAFAGTGITDIKLPNSLISIGMFAFSTSSLMSIDIPENIKNIETGVFYDCSDLTNVTLPDGLISIGMSTFAKTSLKHIDIPDSVMTIGIPDASFGQGVFAEIPGLSATFMGMTFEAEEGSRGIFDLPIEFYMAVNRGASSSLFNIDSMEEITLDNLSESQLELLTTLTEKFQNAIEQLLIPLFGASNIRVNVNTGLNFDRVISERVKFDPPVPGEMEMIVSEIEVFGSIEGRDDYLRTVMGNNWEINEARTMIEREQGVIDRISISIRIANEHLNDDNISELNGIIAKAIGISPEYISIIRN